MTRPGAGLNQELGAPLHATLLYPTLGARVIRTLPYPILAGLAFRYLPVGFAPALRPDQPQSIIKFEKPQNRTPGLGSHRGSQAVQALRNAPLAMRRRGGAQ
ncbi:hypothetical protein PHLCEN_2v3094 [Hermanssonia centrifuga]|uniref:Uncharacterized protein n=1 Tax=Hermanssonia centrifuga TaxID=98765 RepID=A0A2R6R784_9APHY|nr:hypothetical protein PHLCEN_2v3094 [Hermanssonia centrifuga]